MTIKKLLSSIVLTAFVFATGAFAKEVTVGYQGVLNPWKVAIADGTFEQRTGYKINWRKFDSGGSVINAMASGDVHIAMAGSSPIAAGIANGLPIQVFWIVEDIASAEALVVRNGAGINSPADLRGKRVGVPFVSTTHFHMLFALEHYGIDPKDVELRNLQPPQIAAAWRRGDIDAAFIWDPVLGQIKKNGKVLVTSGELSALGKATFDGMVVNTKFAKANNDFMVEFTKIMNESTRAYSDNPRAWNADKSNAQKVARLAGGEASQVADVLELYAFPTAKIQASSTWLGGGEKGGVAQAIKHTAEFLKAQKKVDATPRRYKKFVNDKFAKAAMR